MKLYYAPGACSLATHIALREAGLTFDLERVDLRTKTTASGADYRKVSPKGYVPTLVLDDGEVLTENVAVLDWIAAAHPALGVPGPLGRTRLLEALAYISSEIHKAYKPMFHGSDEEKGRVPGIVEGRLQYLADHLQGDYLFGSRVSVADCYLFVMLRWAKKFGVSMPEPLDGLRSRMEGRESVQAATKREAEGL
jgi:glutathione S-transferase